MESPAFLCGGVFKKSKNCITIYAENQHGLGAMGIVVVQQMLYRTEIVYSV